ncbi:MAG: hypothetical protein SFY67_11765 [Candidatus Melainabacteria bacterium]|nr:hypothetical protein [Candidatus Melainabacteria bacterium]
MSGLKTLLLSLSIAGVSALPAYSQVAGANQSIFNDEEQMMGLNQAQVRQYEQQKVQAETELSEEQRKNAPYRLFVEKQITTLSAPSKNPKAASANAAKLKQLQDWIKRDNDYIARQQSYINQLTGTIQNLQRTQSTQIGNLQNDITAMRENQQDEKDAKKFDQMMQVNYFNELQSEMGAASWGRPPEDGTYNSVGGYGFMGGYGYSGGFGRRNF